MYTLNIWTNVFPGVFPGFLTPLLTQLFVPMTLTTFLTSFNKGERRKYAGHEVLLNQVSNLNHQLMMTRSPLGHSGGTPGFWNIIPIIQKKKRI